jgi:hypothetical protein
VSGVVTEGVEADLALWEKRLPGITDSSLARLAVALASGIDAERGSLTAVSNASNSLKAVLEDLRDMLPPEVAKDELDELNKRRQKRRAV